MVSSGNGRVKTCVNNLLQMFMGENPYERTKGLDPRVIDMPTEEIKAQAVNDAWTLIDAYEPRAVIDSIYAVNENSPEGGLRIIANLSGEGEATNG